MELAALKALLKDGWSVERIAQHFSRHPSTVAYWMDKHGLEAVNRERHAARGGIERDELERMVAAGLSIAQIAEAVERSKATVRHWLRRYGLKTLNSVGGGARAQSARAAKEAGILTVTRMCEHHGETEFVLEGRGYYRCKACRSARVAEHRRKLKRILVEEAGGGCSLCGYNRYLGALEFHHIDPSQKRLEISWNGVTLALDAVRAEARKCVLLCSNCHAEVEAGVAQLAATV
jgi:transposase